jgi:hypothetical protein
MTQRVTKARHARRRRRTAAKKAAAVEQLLSSPTVADSPPAVRAWLTALLRHGERAAGPLTDGVPQQLSQPREQR